jgi:DNA-binding transcriptional LysR family regulator
MTWSFVISAAVDGVGLAYMSEEHGADHLGSGAVVKLLDDWCQPYSGFFLRYPSRRNQPAALTALINTLHAAESTAVKWGFVDSKRNL